MKKISDEIFALRSTVNYLTRESDEQRKEIDKCRTEVSEIKDKVSLLQIKLEEVQSNK